MSSLSSDFIVFKLKTSTETIIAWKMWKENGFLYRNQPSKKWISAQRKTNNHCWANINSHHGKSDCSDVDCCEQRLWIDAIWKSHVEAHSMSEMINRRMSLKWDFCSRSANNKHQTRCIILSELWVRTMQIKWLYLTLHHVSPVITCVKQWMENNLCVGNLQFYWNANVIR